MITMPEPILDRLLHLPADKVPLITDFLDTLSAEGSVNKNVSKRIGVAKDISFPADFDEIDYGTAELLSRCTS